MSTEQAVSFGEEFSLNGIVCKGEGESTRPALIILNSGLMHRVGTCRTSVALAREAAEVGMLSLRFDHSGIGDSSPRQIEASDEERMLEEINAALDFLQETFGISRFVIYGLCSGAVYSFKYALKDNRVIGLVGIDGYAYPTIRFYLRHYGLRFFRFHAWIRLLLRIRKLLPAKPKVTYVKESDEVDVWMWQPQPSRDFVEQGYQSLVEKGVRLYSIYTGEPFSYNYQGQMTDMYPNVDFSDLLTIDYFPDSSHIMQEPRFQKEIRQKVLHWLEDLR